MNRRRPAGGRTLAAGGAVLALVGCVLPWWRLGGDSGLPALGGNAFEGSGILVFLVAVATLALVALPYAMGDRPTAVDRWISYALLAVVGWFGLGWRVLDLLLSGAFRFDQPTDVFTNGPGLWLSGIGLAILSRAVYRMTREPAYR
ncbi:MAG: hypothetical protein H0U58_02480 [Chloroflexi bacterium]|nr:hypothetical protein [Chloroflexota bacterium]